MLAVSCRKLLLYPLVWNPTWAYLSQVRPLALPKLSLFSTSISVSDAFDGGNIEKESEGGEIHTVRLRIKNDIYTELEQKYHSQYFCFRASVNDLESTETRKVTYAIENADSVSYPRAWDGASIFFTTNIMAPKSWQRKTDTMYDGKRLSWTHTHEGSGSCFFSYFPPFTYCQHLDLIAKCQEIKTASVHSLGQSLQGREIECVSAGTGSRVCWIIHRQHPGEHMAEYYAEGLLTRLLGLDTEGEVDEDVQKALELYTFHIVPSMCPDGAVLGHLRTNAAGANLNREWCSTGDYVAPSSERSPEVLSVLNAMDSSGVDCFLDIHGDEELPFNFLSGAELTENWGPRLQALHGVFLGAYTRANSDMQKEIGYSPPSDSSGALPNIATNAIANRFDCLSATLEMPFKDCATNPDPVRGWSPDRSKALGASSIEPLIHIHPYLRSESKFWESLSEDDNYVVPTSKYKV